MYSIELLGHLKIRVCVALLLFVLVFQSTRLWRNGHTLRRETVLSIRSKPVATSNSASDIPYPFYNETCEDEHPENFARAFELWPSKVPLPCYEPDRNWKSSASQYTKTRKGLIFLSPFKTGSTTATGVHLRLARNIALRQHAKFDVCKNRFRHTKAVHLVPNRSRDQSFLWTIVRDPTKRAVSSFFYDMSGHQDPTDAHFKKWIRILATSNRLKDHYLRRFATSPLRYIRSGEEGGYTYTRKDNDIEIVKNIFADYDFMAITERMDESLVAMSMLMGAPLADILYIIDNKSGGQFSRHSTRDKCKYLLPSFVTSGMKEFFRSAFWQDIVHWDHVIYQAANRSLDMTIERLGPKFKRKLAQYRTAKEMALLRCAPRTVFPCSEGGEFRPDNATDCMYLDTGCGNECLDEVATELDLW
uniref:Sulfotransferase domain-containing protein n=1 Tax=Attheya septentrionalis TaxID=420275 RepID=A0A7S2U8K8_9STRA|mmetsp:Transcript_13379/g.24237  ORF Transcript_13379/g.24237 Transcript_13379/m.24237 type:complete len:417 (+) Transcript_13379:48-1298(+)